MNIQKALKCARKCNCAIRQNKWVPGVYLQHGMDNVLRFADGREFPVSVAELLRTDWHLTGEGKYQRSANTKADGLR